MGNVYNNQDYLRVSLTYTADISADITSVKIKYIKPDDTEGEWTAVHVPATKTVYYNIPKDTFLSTGGWRFWIFATMSDTRVITGEVVEQEITEEGTE